jgi:hypothetical protein
VQTFMPSSLIEKVSCYARYSLRSRLSGGH